VTINWGLALQTLPVLLQGAVLTLELTAGAVAIGVVLGLFLALGRLSHTGVLRVVCRAYIDFFRGTPLLAQLFLTGFGLPQLFGWQSQPENYPFIAATLTMGLNSGAYVAEIFRGGIQSIDRGQTEAARSLGMSHAQALRYIILPQAIKRVIPPLGNEFIAMLKDSSLVAILAIEELMYAGKIMVGRTFQPLPIYLMVTLIYLVMTVIISQILARVERWLGKSDLR